MLAVVRQEAVQCFFYCAVICSHIDDLVLSAPARAKRAELTVTSPPLPPRFPLCVTFPSCLRSVCLREAEMSSEIGWDAVNVGQELPVPTGLLSGSPNLPKNVPSLFRSSAATEGLVLGHVVHSSFLSLGFIWIVFFLVTTSFLIYTTRWAELKLNCTVTACEKQVTVDQI